MDGPLEIVQGALDAHVRMINEFKGVPGVKPDRLSEGMQVLPLTHMGAIMSMLGTYQ